ncbi:MAG: ATP-binding protein [Cyanobacteria bacterium]|nr:ATP-binding protein [Cyanobacteriota bacterium]MDA1020444.1 ATP-binding protein [Cyanobacteriota bacterium]
MASKKRLLELPQQAHFFLFGPRQVGKSTLIKHSFCKESSAYYNLLLEKEYTRLVAHPELLAEEVRQLDPQISHVIIDEVQRIPALLNEVHNLIENLDRQIYFVLSGSSARKLKRGQANMLGGRAWTRRLYPLSYSELGEDFDLGRALRFGTLPAIYLNDDEAAQEMLQSYVETYLTEEIKAEAIVRNMGAFTRFLRLAASESGNLLNYSNIAREAATSNQSIKEYFQVLEDTLIGSFLKPYNKSTRKRLVKHPKFYLFDNGVRNALLNNLSDDIIPATYTYGVVFEHFIINEIIKLNRYYKKNWDLSFYRSSNDTEVDLIIEKPDGHTLAIEIKSSENPSKADLRGLFSFQEINQDSELICVSRAARAKELGEITVYPWRDFLDKLFS